MGGKTVSPDELLERIEALDVETGDGATTKAYVDLGQRLNLNAIAIGLDLDRVVYEPERFPGLVYLSEAYEATSVVVFENGTVFANVGASANVHEIVDDTVDQLEDLGLVDGADPASGMTTTPTAIPVPTEYEETGDSANRDAEDESRTDNEDGSAGVDSDPICTGCGYELTGEENYCPDCGEEVRPDCPECEHELTGTENYCPECGTALAAD